MKTLLTLLLLFPLLFLSCKDSGDDVLRSPVTLPPPPGDTVRFEFRLEGLKETYTLDDTISGVMIAINKASSRPLRFSAAGYPPEHWSLRRVGIEEFDFFYPFVIELTLYGHSLDLGDTISFKVSWAQQAFASNVRNQESDLQRAFAGEYEFCGYLPYSNMFGNISFTRTITIEERGKVLSSVLAGMSFLNDTVDYGLALRNRVSRVLEYPIDDSLPVKVSFSVGTDTVLKRAYALPFSVLSLQPFSDNMPFRFQRPERDTMFSGMRGTYKMNVSLVLRDLEIRASKLVLIH